MEVIKTTTNASYIPTRTSQKLKVEGRGAAASARQEIY